MKAVIRDEHTKPSIKRADYKASTLYYAKAWLQGSECTDGVFLTDRDRTQITWLVGGPRNHKNVTWSLTTASSLDVSYNVTEFTGVIELSND